MENRTLNISKINAFYSNTQILKDLDFSLESSQLICLCGPNGCGKSTLLSIIAGLQNNSLKVSGQVLLNNEDNLLNKNEKERAKIISTLLQTEYSTWNFSVKDFILQGRFCHTRYGDYSKEDYEITNEAISLMEIQNLSDRNVHTLSGGEFQKVRIARSLCQKSPFLLLDEPASGLDFVYEAKLMKTLKTLCKNQNLGIIISIHDINTASRWADKILLLSPSKNYHFGVPKEVINSLNIKEAFNADCKITENPYPQIILG